MPWQCYINNQFAADFFSKQPWNPPSGNLVSARLCSDCTHFNSASKLRTLGDNCPLCKLLFDVVLRSHSGSHQQIPIVRDDLALKTAGPRIICLCTDLGSSLPSFNNITTLLTTLRLRKNNQ